MTQIIRRTSVLSLTAQLKICTYFSFFNLHRKPLLSLIMHITRVINLATYPQRLIFPSYYIFKLNTYITC